MPGDRVTSKPIHPALHSLNSVPRSTQRGASEYLTAVGGRHNRYDRFLVTSTGNSGPPSGIQADRVLGKAPIAPTIGIEPERRLQHCPLTRALKSFEQQDEPIGNCLDSAINQRLPALAMGTQWV